MERQYFEEMGMSPLTAPFNCNGRNYAIQQQLQLQHPNQVPLARPIPISMAPSGLSPVSLGYSGYSTNRPFGSYSCPGEFNSFPLNDPTPVYHPDTVNFNEHRQCDLYPIRDGFHWSYTFPASPGSEPSAEPVNFNNNTQEFPAPPEFYPGRFNGQRAMQAVDFLPVANVADCTLTSSVPFGYGTVQPSRVTLVSPKSPIANFHGTIPSASAAPASINNTQSEQPTFHPNQFNGQQAMQAADFLPAADVADQDHTLTLTLPMAFGSAQPPRVMVFDEKSPMATYLEKFPPGDYTMEIRVIPTNSDNSNSGSSDNGFEEDSSNGDEGKERMKLVIL